MKPATETETVANATPAATTTPATAAPAAPAANTTTGDIYTDVIAQYRIASDKEVYPYSYAMADLNLDGYPELMVKTGNCEANYAYEIWTKEQTERLLRQEQQMVSIQIYIIMIRMERCIVTIVVRAYRKL